MALWCELRRLLAYVVVEYGFVARVLWALTVSRKDFIMSTVSTEKPSDVIPRKAPATMVGGRLCQQLK